ncbi:MAG TPA: polyketide cyclase [Fibrobacteres bacterium]|jgi:uncharacterized protein YndB with AHSA1/START domain|nr:polyketide cyclase [Fibrobacterota bacterium]
MNHPNNAVTGEDFIISRTFNAPRDLVWKVWTEPAHIGKWMNPFGGEMSFAKMDFRSGGMAHYYMATPDGGKMWGLVKYLEIAQPEKVVQIQSFADAEGNIISHPMSATWPKEMHSTAAFTEQDGKTTITITWRPYNATEVEQQTFDGARPGMTQGWTGSLDQLEVYLKEMQA